MRVGWKYKIGLMSAYLATYSVLYLYPNFFPPSPPFQLPLYALDLSIPILPWSFLVYISDYALFLTVLFLHDNLGFFNAFAKQAFAVLVVCGLFFLFLPTTYPRPEYPQAPNVFLAGVMWVIRNWDTPNNCFPSMHVAMTAIGVWSLRNRDGRLVSVYSLWALAIFVSTLTTKQHYILDVLGGIAVAVIVLFAHWFVFERLGAHALGKFRPLKDRRFL
jgi:membrane-associated phospholipid phosphatase